MRMIAKLSSTTRTGRERSKLKAAPPVQDLSGEAA
jgi:hypothetical protein